MKGLAGALAKAYIPFPEASRIAKRRDALIRKQN